MNELNFNEPPVQIDLPDLFGTEKTKENVAGRTDSLIQALSSITEHRGLNASLAAIKLPAPAPAPILAPAVASVEPSQGIGDDEWPVVVPDVIVPLGVSESYEPLGIVQVEEEVSLDVAIATPPATPVEEKGDSLADYKRWALEYKKEEEALLRDAFKTAQILVSYDFDPTATEFDYLENVLKMAFIKRGVYNECRYEISKRLFDQFISE
ncbi:hypothetical protein LRQ11_06775 [Pseudomonas sp. MAFF 311095]|uniref:hypothetical protein n=1 Tax=Pseudomonas petroselini TaxID=2899822 RepID=UPI0020B2E6E4|nr:hypothetical protein [Pseudomonas petroselini]MCD7078627.1 hypothetical protein [Pseudomonas petroselini]